MQSSPAWAGYYSDNESETFTICFRKVNLPRQQKSRNSIDSEAQSSPQLMSQRRGLPGIFPTECVFLVAIMEIRI